MGDLRARDAPQARIDAVGVGAEKLAAAAERRAEQADEHAQGAVECFRPSHALRRTPLEGELSTQREARQAAELKHGRAGRRSTPSSACAPSWRQSSPARCRGASRPRRRRAPPRSRRSTRPPLAQPRHASRSGGRRLSAGHELSRERPPRKPPHQLPARGETLSRRRWPPDLGARSRSWRPQPQKIPVGSRSISSKQVRDLGRGP